MTVKSFKNLLVLICAPLGLTPTRDRSHKQSGKRIIWSMLSKKLYYADNKIIARINLAQVDYYTDDENDTFPDELENQLSRNHISVSSEFAGMWDDETKSYRHCWTLEF
jgi:hypothetical protein